MIDPHVDPSASPWTERAVACLLRLYPAHFRASFGTGMREALRRDAAAARAKGRGAALLFWTITTLDACRFGLAERRPFTPRPASPRDRRQGEVRMRSLTIDWRDGWRSLRATPLVTVIAVLSLALGIGATTALFSILNTLVFKPLPVRDPEQLVVLAGDSWTNPIWQQVRAEHRSFAAAAFAWADESFDLATAGETDLVEGLYASGGMFDVLGVPALRGRLLTVEDDEDAGHPAAPVVVLSYGFWQRRYGGAGDVIGRTLSLDRIPFTIVGVTPQGFFGPQVGRAFDVAVPIGAERLLRGRESVLDNRLAWWLEIGLRLRAGQTVAQATDAFRAAQPRIRAATMPENWGPQDQTYYLRDPLTLVAAGAGRSALRNRYERPLTTIMVVAAAVLFIACANIANLLLARAVTRRRELSVRLALGASRFRLSRQLLAESVMLTAAGVGLGLLVAQWGSRALVSQLVTEANQVFLDLAFDWRVLGFTVAVALATTLMFGLAPALGVSSVAPNDALREQGRGLAGDRRLGLRNGLVVAQIAFSLALVVVAGLLARTFVQLTTRDVGFDRRPVLIVKAAVQRSAVAVEDRLALLERMRTAVTHAPGVASASVSFTAPVFDRGWNGVIEIPNSSLPPRQRLTWINALSPGWFDTFGVRLIAGRDFDARDTSGSPRVAVVNRAFVRRYLSGDQPVGAHFSQEREPQPYEVIGVVEDTVYRSVRSEMTPTMYVPLTQMDLPMTSAILGVRVVSGTPLAVARTVGDVLKREEPNASLSFQALADLVGASLAQERLVALLSAFFGVLALALAALGLYGVTSYSVSRRRAEIGVRMALGADPGGVVRLVLRRVGGLVTVGLIAGAGLSLWVTRFVTTLLYGLQPWDPLTLATAAIVLGLVGLLAGWLPARRAARIDPTLALREG